MCLHLLKLVAKQFLPLSVEIFGKINSENISYQELITPFFGRCYTICKQENISDGGYTTLTFSSNFSYKVFLHNQNEEFWLAGVGFFPTEIVSVDLGKSLVFSNILIIIWFSEDYFFYQYIF